MSTLVGLGGCQAEPTPTQVVVELEAEASVEADASRLLVEVVGQGGVRVQRSVIIGENGVNRWPFRVPIVPLGGDATRRVFLAAEVFDPAGASLGVQRAHLSFVEDELRRMRLVFASACTGETCNEFTTCIEGECEDACRLPQVNRDEVIPGPCTSERIDAGGQPADAGVPDSSMISVRDSAIPQRDGGPGIPAWCPDAVASGLVETFDDIERLASCDEEAPPCEASPAGTAEVVDQGSVTAPGGELPCAGGLFRAVRFAAPSAAYYVLPAATGESLHARAWLRVDSPDDREASVLAIVAGSDYLDAEPDGIELRVGPDTAMRVEHAGMVERMGVPRIEENRWTCVELSIDPPSAQVTVGIEGERVAMSIPEGLRDALATSGHVRVGQYRVPEGDEGQVFVDHVGVSAERYPCPLRR